MLLRRHHSAQDLTHLLRVQLEKEQEAQQAEAEKTSAVSIATIVSCRKYSSLHSIVINSFRFGISKDRLYNFMSDLVKLTVCGLFYQLYACAYVDKG